MSALPVWHAHPTVTVRESVGPSGLPGAQLRLASIWPDSGNTWLFKNKSNNGWTKRGGRSNGDFRTLIPRIKTFLRPTARLKRGANSEVNGDKLGRLASLCSDRNPSRCWIKKDEGQPDRRTGIVPPVFLRTSATKHRVETGNSVSLWVYVALIGASRFTTALAFSVSLFLCFAQACLAAKCACAV